MSKKMKRFVSAGLSAVALLALSAAPAMAAHHQLNGAWVLEPTLSDFAGEKVLQTGKVTINERQHHIYVSRTMNYDGTEGGFNYSFTTDGEDNATIHNGKSLKTKAKWDGDTLEVKTTQDGLTTVEHFNLIPSGNMQLKVERPDHKVITLVFHRQ